MSTLEAVSNNRGLVRSVSARQGTLREYETVVILSSIAGRPEIMNLVERMQTMFGQVGARLLKIDNWGVRTLAYPIRRNTKGVYLYWRYLGGSDVVAEFERLLRNMDLVLRYYSVRVDEDVDPEARPSEITEEILNAVAETAPEPEPEPTPLPPQDLDDRDFQGDDLEEESEDQESSSGGLRERNRSNDPIRGREEN